ncbi:MAG TPA: FG-GAP repeat protein, partial [Planctomycetota bacterium]|nr:FG-GAP repeat protein [Planctomycetota bacterium]
ATAGQWFGLTVAIDGDVALVGAAGDNGWVGAAYVFRDTGTHWVEVQKFEASDGSQYDGLGAAVALSGLHAVVGAPNDCTPAGTSTGSAYAYDLPVLALQSNLAVALPRNTLTLTTCGGAPGTLGLLGIVAVNSVPVVLPLDVGLFGSAGTRALSVPVPVGLAGLTFDFRSLGVVSLPSTLGLSNGQTVLFQ